MSDIHRYRTHTHWQGTTSRGYDQYNRAHTAAAPPAVAQLSLTSDPAFHGEPALLNPEQLVVMAASSCQMLSFLAASARTGVDVLEYEDTAEGEMPMAERPVRITRIVLRPRIVVRGASEAQVRELVERAHRQCFIANSLRSEMEIHPEIEIRS